MDSTERIEELFVKIEELFGHLSNILQGYSKTLAKIFKSPFFNLPKNG